MILESGEGYILIIGTPLPKYPSRGEPLPVAIASTDWTQEGFGVIGYARRKTGGLGCLGPLDRNLLANPDFSRDFSELPEDKSAKVRPELLEQSLREISSNSPYCDPRLFHVIEFNRVRMDIEALLGYNSTGQSRSQLS